MQIDCKTVAIDRNTYQVTKNCNGGIHSKRLQDIAVDCKTYQVTKNTVNIYLKTHQDILKNKSTVTRCKTYLLY